MVGGWAEIASPSLPRDRLLISKTGPMSGRGIAETKCQEFAVTEAALAPPWPRRVIDRLILAHLPSAPEWQGPRVISLAACDDMPSMNNTRKDKHHKVGLSGNRNGLQILSSLHICPPSTMRLLPQ